MKYADLLLGDGKKLGTTDMITHKIPVVNDLHVYAKPYSLPHALKEELDRQLQMMMESDMIEPSISEYSSPIFLIPKPPSFSRRKMYRLVVNLQSLKARTIKDEYPLPNPPDIID